MKAFVTGGAGFVGSALVRSLRARGDDVRALVRSAAGAHALRGLGCELVEGDLAASRLAEWMDGCDSVFHVAGIFRVGIRADERGAMFAANVEGTASVLDAAAAASVARIVHVSTANAFGNTGYRVVDETYERPRPYRYLSYYDETKHLAHLAAADRAAGGAPIVIVMPTQVYGPNDHSEIGGVMQQAASGKLATISLGDLGVSMVHVDDVAGGALLAHDRGELGESYCLAGEISTLRELVIRVAAIVGRRPPRFTTPGWLLRGMAPLGPLLAPVLRTAPNLRETVAAGAGVTYWASNAKARRELGWEPRDLETGLRDLFAASAAHA